MEKFDTRVKWSQIMVHIYDKDKCSRFDSANKIERNHLLFYCIAVKNFFISVNIISESNHWDLSITVFDINFVL